MTEPLSSAEYEVRAANTPADVERAARLSGAIHGPEAAQLTRALFQHHPDVSLGDLMIAEHLPSAQIVSTLCLIPWSISFDGVVIPAGEMGIVGTLEAYRQRGGVKWLRKLPPRDFVRLLERTMPREIAADLRMRTRNKMELDLSQCTEAELRRMANAVGDDPPSGLGAVADEA